MSYYKYYIDKEQGMYKFGLFPNNNNTQAIGESGLYNSKGDATDALRIFQMLIKESSNPCGLFDTTKGKDERKCTKYSFNLKENKYNLIFYRPICYYQKHSRDMAIQRIIQNIDSPLKQR